MMKKQHQFSIPNRPTTAKKPSQQNNLVNSLKKMSISPKQFQSANHHNPNHNQQHIQLHKLYQTMYFYVIILLVTNQYTNKNNTSQLSCKRKVQALRQLAQKRQVQQIKERHKQQILQIQKAHLQEMNCFNIEWDKVIQQLHQHIGKMEEELIRRHQEQIISIEEEMNNQKPKNFKESPQLLNLRKIEQELAKQQNYLQAHQVQKKAEKLQKQEIEKWKKNNQSKGKNSLNLIKLRQDSQISALKQKIQLIIEQKQRQKRQQQQRLILKYENIIKQLQFQQNQQLHKCQKIAKLSAVQKKSKPGLYGTTSRTSLA